MTGNLQIKLITLIGSQENYFHRCFQTVHGYHNWQLLNYNIMIIPTLNLLEATDIVTRSKYDVYSNLGKKKLLINKSHLYASV